MNEKEEKILKQVVFTDDKGNKKKIGVKLPNLEDMPEGKYSNYVLVTHGPDEFTLNFAKINFPSTLDQAANLKNITLNIVSRIVVSPTLIKPLKKAIETNIRGYESTFGYIQERKINE